ncbi:MAG TPA: HDOD domain-containing protein [Woeseiaceae bacterium]|nr:HDOD domain-containing protein [Woeseiaceae bacterium]
MDKSDQFRFVSLLALELDNGDIALPSLPDVVMKIRRMLERDDCDFGRISQAVSIDPVLVSRLFVFANSAFYNRANVKIDTLDGAIGRLGFEVVRNAAMSLAMKQLYGSDKNDKSAKHLRAVWARGMKLSSMAFAIADTQPHLNSETAFLCGLMHEVGKLYILTKAEEFPEFLGNPQSLSLVLEEWNPQVSKCIIESWGFPDEVVESTDPETYQNHDIDTPTSLVDVIRVAKMLLDSNEQKLQVLFENDLSCQKLAMSDNSMSRVMDAYRAKLQTMQQSLA